jgi:hypothetical protein
MDVGLRVATEARLAGFHRYNVSIDPVPAHQMGHAAEIAVCKLLGLEWKEPDVRTRHNGDAWGLEVRCRRSTYKAPYLLLNARDQTKLDRKFIHVVSIGGQRFQVYGWAYGYEVCTPENVFERPMFVERLWRMEIHRLRDIRTVLEV